MARMFFFVRFLCPILSCATVSKPAIAQSLSAATPHAEVTFYSTGSAWKAIQPGYKHGDFSGRLFDDSHDLANLRPGTFITFDFAAGPHTFSSNYLRLKTTHLGAHLDLPLEAGKHYYIGAYFRTTIPGQLSIPILEETPCVDAHKTLARAKAPSAFSVDEKAIYIASDDISGC